MIFRFAMPDDRTRPLHLEDPTWDEDSDIDYETDSTSSIDDRMKPPKPAEAIPTQLFTANKSISAESLEAFRNEFYFRMDISPFAIRARHHLTDFLYEERLLVTEWDVLTRWRPFEKMRNYHLNIKSNAMRYDPYGDKDPSEYKDGARRIKEWLRMICDELCAKDVIRNLTITAPCICAARKAKLVPKDESQIFDLFAPLQRLRLVNAVTLSLHNDKLDRGSKYPCRRKRCRSLADRIRANIGQLEGEPLSEQEAAWKEIKAIASSDKTFASFKGHEDVKDVWATMNGIETWPDMTFEEAVQKVYGQHQQPRSK